jgi:hypothetical protein
MSRETKMAVGDRRYNKTAPAEIGCQASAREPQRLLINFTRPSLECENGFHLDQGEAGDEELRSRFRKNSINEITAKLMMIELSQRAGVNEIPGQSAISAFLKHRFRKRPADGRKRLPDFVEADIIVGRIGPLLAANEYWVIRHNASHIGDRDGDLLLFLEKQRFQGVQNTFFVHSPHRLLHSSQSSRFQSCAVRVQGLP